MLSAVHTNPDTPPRRDGASICSGHSLVDTQFDHAAASTSGDHHKADTHDGRVAGSTCAAHFGLDTHGVRGGATSCSDHEGHDTHHAAVAAPHDALLLILADAVDDLERVRIATDNRIRSLVQVKGLEDSPERRRLEKLRDGIAALEHAATRDLQRAMRAHPLGPWVKRTIGVGEKQAARLLAAIGDPADRPNPAKLWQYAGHGDSARSKLRKGQPVEHNPIAKMRTRLIANSCIKQMHSPYRAVYDRERVRWADRDTTDLHKHNHALRVVGKAMLLDLWREARELRGGQERLDIHAGYAPADLPPTNTRAMPMPRPSAAHLGESRQPRDIHTSLALASSTQEIA
jgi:hypothetical protein